MLEGQDQEASILEISEGIIGSFGDESMPEKAHSGLDWTGLETEIRVNSGSDRQRIAESRPPQAEPKSGLLNKPIRKKRKMLSTPAARNRRMIMLNVIETSGRITCCRGSSKRASGCAGTARRIRVE